MEIHFKIVGLILIPLSAIHVIFPKYFNWKRELSTVSLINKQMIYVHTFFIAFVIMLMAILCLTAPGELTHTDLGKKISLGLGLFWFARLVIQFFGYSSVLWKGKTFETTIHIFFALMWSYLSGVFLINFMN